MPDKTAVADNPDRSYVMGMPDDISISVVPDKRAGRAPIRDPYAAAAIVSACWSTAFFRQQKPVAMGTGVRRDDIEWMIYPSINSSYPFAATSSHRAR